MRKKKLIEDSLPEEGKRTVQDVLNLFNKTNKDAEIILLDGEVDKNIPVISYGSLFVDRASGVGGMPQGKIIEIFGMESVGKSTLAAMAIVQCQKNEGIAAYIDLENALDVRYFQALGIDVKSLLISQPSCGEEAVDTATNLTGILSSGDMIVVDSVAALVPRAEIEGGAGDSHMGLQARLVSQALRKLTALANKRGVTIVFINQLRQKIGVVYGDPNVTTGGNALKFYASQRIDMRKVGSTKDKDGSIISNTIRVKFVKNKVAPPFKEAEVTMSFGRGIPKEWEVLQLAVEFGFMEKAGTWYKYNGEAVGQGDELAMSWLRDNQSVMSQLEAQIREKL